MQAAQLQALADGLGLTLPVGGLPEGQASANAPEPAALPQATRAALATELAFGQGVPPGVGADASSKGITDTTNAVISTPVAGWPTGLTTQITADESSGSSMTAPTPGPTAAPVDFTQTENILIFGTDYRPGDPNWRTDSIMIVVVDPALSRVGTSSAYRANFGSTYLHTGQSGSMLPSMSVRSLDILEAARHWLNALYFKCSASRHSTTLS